MTSWGLPAPSAQTAQENERTLRCGFGGVFHLFFLHNTGLGHRQTFYGSCSYKNPSHSVAQNLASRQLYPQVSEHVNLYNVRSGVCFLRFEFGVEQRCAVLVHMYFALSDKMWLLNYCSVSEHSVVLKLLKSVSLTTKSLKSTQTLMLPW